MAVFLWWNLRVGLFYRYHFFGALSVGIAVGCGCNYLQSSLERILIQPRNQMLWFLLLGLTARLAVWRRQDARLRREEALNGEVEDVEDPSDMQPVIDTPAEPVETPG